MKPKKLTKQLLSPHCFLNNDVVQGILLRLRSVSRSPQLPSRSVPFRSVNFPFVQFLFRPILVPFLPLVSIQLCAAAVAVPPEPVSCPFSYLFSSSSFSSATFQIRFRPVSFHSAPFRSIPVPFSSVPTHSGPFRPVPSHAILVPHLSSHSVPPIPPFPSSRLQQLPVGRLRPSAAERVPSERRSSA